MLKQVQVRDDERITELYQTRKGVTIYTQSKEPYDETNYWHRCLYYPTFGSLHGYEGESLIDKAEAWKHCLMELAR